MFLEKINLPEDLKKLNEEQLKILAQEIREFLINSVSETGGHLSSNLGVVELTLALHYCFNMSEDKLVWDVGHQSYVHKILTGRKDRFSTLRKLDGLSGFPKRKESKYDVFDVGHSSTSISAALGYAKARDLCGGKNYVIAVIGDGSLTGGLAYEALNNVGRCDSNIIVIVNDNEMSISPNVGSLAKHLNDIRTAPKYLDVKADVNNILNKIPVVGGKVAVFLENAKTEIRNILVKGGIFSELGFRYFGTIDGHNIEELIKVLNTAKRINGPVLIHVHTKKGKGYKYSEKSPEKYHGIDSFDVATGKTLKPKKGKTYSEIFGDTIVELAQKEDKLIAITAAMQESTGLGKFAKKYSERFFDVGIAEAHAVTFAGGLAAAGYKPVFAVYSSFLQRAYDEVVHDICIQNLPVVFAIDRAGIVGADGETHQGILDISFLSHIPNLTLIAPKDGLELKKMLEYALKHNGPVAIRYPRGEAIMSISENTSDIEYKKSEIIKKGKDIALIALGDMVLKALNVCERLEKLGYEPMVVNARFVSPLDEEMLKEVSSKCRYIFTLENNICAGGFGSKILEKLSQMGIYSSEVNILAFPDKFIEQGSCEELFKRYKLNEDAIFEQIKNKIGSLH